MRMGRERERFVRVFSFCLGCFAVRVGYFDH